MQIERSSIYSVQSHQFSNRMDYEERRSSFCSLDRFSERRKSLSNRVSLINAMQLQGRDSRKSEMVNQILGDRQRFSDFMRNSNASKQSYEYKNDAQALKSSNKSHFRIIHECSCTNQCNSEHCICFLSPTQICVVGLCCKGCIQRKNIYLKSVKGFKLARQKQQLQKGQQNSLLYQIKNKKVKNMHYLKQVHANQPGMDNLVFCTCKKSHCQKKYCICFEKGLKCGDYCVCEQCLNREQCDDDQSKSQKQRKWERYGTYNKAEQGAGSIQVQIDQDIDQFFQQDLKSTQFLEKMEFQPVNFDYLISNVSD